jgi:hypothetical protein
VGPIFNGDKLERKWAAEWNVAAHLRSNLCPLNMGLTAAPETSSRNLPYTPCKINQYLLHGESLKIIIYFVDCRISYTEEPLITDTLINEHLQ